MKNGIYHSELRALLSIRNFSNGLEKHYSQMVQIQKNLEELNKNALAIIVGNCSTEAQEKYKVGLKKIDRDLKVINEVLNLGKEKVNSHDRSNSSALWNKFDLHLNNIKEEYKNLEKLGFEILPESEHVHWKKDICNFEAAILPLIVSHAKTCQIELQMIEKYTPDEIHNISQIIFNHIPEDFNFEQADKYEKDYLNVFEDFKNEFRKDKNLWDKFLDILAGGTHQSPSERVMMQRWVEGEKQDL